MRREPESYESQPQLNRYEIFLGNLLLFKLILKIKPFLIDILFIKNFTKCILIIFIVTFLTDPLTPPYSPTPCPLFIS